MAPQKARGTTRRRWIASGIRSQLCVVLALIVCLVAGSFIRASVLSHQIYEARPTPTAPPKPASRPTHSPSNPPTHMPSNKPSLSPTYAPTRCNPGKPARPTVLTPTTEVAAVGAVAKHHKAKQQGEAQGEKPRKKKTAKIQHQHPRRPGELVVMCGRYS